MAVPIIPRLVRRRLYFEIGPVLFPTFAQAATAQAHRLDIVDVGGVRRMSATILKHERFERPEDNGKPVRIAGFDPNKPEELRRLWAGNTAAAKVGVL